MNYEHQPAKRIRLNKKSNKQINNLHIKIKELKLKNYELECENKQLKFINNELLEKLNIKHNSNDYSSQYIT